MKRRINLSLHWKSYFINLIWKCKAVWNAGFSLTFLLNMYESQIRWCATLFIQSFFFFFWRIFFFLLMASGSGGVGWLQWPLGSLLVVGGTWPFSPLAVLSREENLLLSILLLPLWALVVYKRCPCSMTMKESGEEDTGGNCRDQSLNQSHQRCFLF